ncbi:methionine aminopeptidase [Lasius niger]|uniref:Methionine aminopeptidase n=1 Tax=Lasius niger TaxID=67767 RepID=A0A0J7NGN4_LASNI|nr:methionine aminopeptidase [Lasius niger]
MSTFVADVKTGKVIRASNPDLPRYPASLTKLMTLYMAFDALKAGRLHLNQKLPVSYNAAHQEPSRLGLYPGTTITVQQAIYGITVKSANDAAATLGEYLGGGDEKKFAKMMTAQAHQLDGWYGDSSRMYVAGKASVKAKKLINDTYEALMRGIEVVKPGATTGDIGHAIETYAKGKRLGVVEDFCGHGIGTVFHDAPNIMHFGQPGTGVKLETGMVFTIEPMLNLGTERVKILEDGWTAVTRDRKLSAQFEHMLGVTEDGYEIFTLSPTGQHKPHFN